MCLSATSLQCQQPHSSVSTVPGPGPGFRQTACWPAAPRFPSVIVLRTHFRQGPNSADDPASHLANSLKAVQVLCRQPLDCAGHLQKLCFNPLRPPSHLSGMVQTIVICQTGTYPCQQPAAFCCQLPQNSAGRRTTPPDQRPCIAARCEGWL
jgi:hypothetical protein